MKGDERKGEDWGEEKKGGERGNDFVSVVWSEADGIKSIKADYYESSQQLLFPISKVATDSGCSERCRTPTRF